MTAVAPPKPDLSVPEQGWQSMKNGELLRRAAGNFGVFVTADQNLEHHPLKSERDGRVICSTIRADGRCAYGLEAD